MVGLSLRQGYRQMSCDLKDDLALNVLQLVSSLNPGDKYFIAEAQKEAFDEKGFFSRVNNVASLAFLTRISANSPHFNELCKKHQNDDLWDKLYSGLGLYLSASKGNRVPFFKHDISSMDKFDMVKGAYLFLISTYVIKEGADPGSETELYLLRKAVQFNSIHAVQRYNDHLYSKVERGLYGSDQEGEELLKEAIKNCKNMLKPYGSYAYMMLTEAYIQYAKWCVDHDDIAHANSAVAAALKACDAAEAYLTSSKYSIHNASLGLGLQASNSLGINTPTAAKSFVEDWREENLNKSRTLSLSR